MALYLNFTDFTVSTEAKADRTPCISAKQLEDLCTAAQLNRFAEKLTGERIKRGTSKPEGCKIIFAAMEKAVKGQKGKAATTENKKPPDEKKTPPVKGGAGGGLTTKKKAAAKPRPAAGEKVGYDKAVQAITTEYANRIEALKVVSKYVGDQARIVARFRNERDERLQALKELKAFL